jgi:hypothetical protein
MRSLYSVSSATSHSSLFTPQLQPLEVVRGASLAQLKGQLDADRRAEGAARWLDGDLLVLPTITQAGSRHLFADCRDFASKITLTRRIVWFPPPAGAHRKSPKENHSWFVWQRPYSQMPQLFYAPQMNARVNRAHCPTKQQRRICNEKVHTTAES